MTDVIADLRKQVLELTEALRLVTISKEDALARAEERYKAAVAQRAPLFVDGEIISHSGLSLPYKIECDALSDSEIATLAAEIARHFVFREVVGVPRGGLRLAAALQRYCSDMGDLLIVDDVLTTGASMEELRPGHIAQGVVIFARGPCPSWITPLFANGFAVSEQIKRLRDELRGLSESWYTRYQAAEDRATKAEEGLREAAEALLAVRKWKAARDKLSSEHPRSLITNREVTEAQRQLDAALARIKELLPP